jgi:hypothetical protein
MTALKQLPLPFVGELSNSRIHSLLRFKYHESGIQSYLDPLIHFVFSSSNLPTEAPQSSGSFKEVVCRSYFPRFLASGLALDCCPCEFWWLVH